MSSMKVLSLFTGIGGFDLACMSAGMEIVGQVEIDDFCYALLCRRFGPDIKRVRDIREVVGDEFGAIDIVVGDPLPADLPRWPAPRCRR